MMRLNPSYRANHISFLGENKWIAQMTQNEHILSEENPPDILTHSNYKQ